MPNEPLRLRVPAALHGKRLDHVLDALVEGASRAQLQKLVRRGRVRVDGKRVARSNIRVQARAELALELDRPRDPVEPASRLRVLHEDAHLLVVDKPAGMLAYPAPRSAAPSVSEELERRFGPLSTALGEERPGIVHRLDKETSGLLVVGRTDLALRHLQEQFRAREVEKTYLALVSHVPPAEPFRIEAPIGPVPGKLDRQRVSPPAEGKDAATGVERVEAFARHALVACRPTTGRRHQIRVHLAHRGFPVVGDPLYGTRRAVPLANAPLARLALHAAQLALRHPDGERPLRFESALPDDIGDALRPLREARG